MKTVRVTFLTSVIILFASTMAAAQNWQTVYQTDFSSDPNWTTNNSERYYWDEASQTLFTNNYTNSGECTTTDIVYNGESFHLAFDVMPVRDPGETGDVNIGLFGPTRISNSSDTEERLYVLFGGYGSQVYIEGYNSGEEKIYSGGGFYLMQNNAWHHVEITYMSESRVLSLEVTRNDIPVLSWQTTMNHGFSSNLSYLGVSLKGSWAASNRHEIAYIDNMTFSLGAVPVPVTLDVKPGACPNQLNVRPFVNDGGDGVDEKDGSNTGGNNDLGHLTPRVVFPVAIMGTDEFDVANINPASLVLEGIPVKRWSYEDVGAPFGETGEVCTCPIDGHDGITDLAIKFDKQAVVRALGDVSDGEIVVLTLTGELLDATLIEGFDCVIIHKRGNKPVKNAPSAHDPLLPVVYLTANYPNPFNPLTTIGFTLNQSAVVQLEVLNVLGQKVATLLDTHLEAGDHTAQWNASDAASGVYLYRLTAGDIIETKKMMLLK